MARGGCEFGNAFWQQTSTFMWQTMANPRINLSFGDALYSDMYHPFMMILGNLSFNPSNNTSYYSASFTGTFWVKNCERVVIFGSPRTISGSGSKFWLRWTVSQNVKISWFLSILPKSGRVVPGTFSGYGKFPKSGSKFRSVNIYFSPRLDKIFNIFEIENAFWGCGQRRLK